MNYIMNITIKSEMRDIEKIDTFIESEIWDAVWHESSDLVHNNVWIESNDFMSQFLHEIRSEIYRKVKARLI